MTYYENTLDDEVFQIILSTCLSTDLSSLNDPRRFRQRARSIGGNIYDMTPLHSGLISRDCIVSILAKKQKSITREHFYGRKECGEEILNYVKRQLSSNIPIDPISIKDIVNRHRQVHFTSKEENVRLATLSKKQPEIRSDWQKMYDLCQIVLIPYVKHQRYGKYGVINKPESL